MKIDKINIDGKKESIEVYKLVLDSDSSTTFSAIAAYFLAYYYDYKLYDYKLISFRKTYPSF